jgi:hypothetical protein
LLLVNHFTRRLEHLVTARLGQGWLRLDLLLRREYLLLLWISHGDLLLLLDKDLSILNLLELLLIEFLITLVSKIHVRALLLRLPVLFVFVAACLVLKHGGWRLFLAV